MTTKTLGKWTFEEANYIPRGQYWTSHCLDDKTIAGEATINGSAVYVRGRVGQDFHHQVQLAGWHKATITVKKGTEQCHLCDGTGICQGWANKACPHTGVNRCHGCGHDEAGPCPDCNGTGKIPLDTAPETVL